MEAHIALYAQVLILSHTKGRLEKLGFRGVVLL